MVVFVETPHQIFALSGLKKRESKRFGDRIQNSGDMYEEHKEFITWAGSYDIGGIDMRSRALHEKWLDDCSCPGWLKAG